MISKWLSARLACPTCLEPAGCPACRREEQGACACEVSYAQRAACECGGPDKVALERVEDGWRCPCCQYVYRATHDGACLSLLPPASVGAVTRYADQEFHERLGVKDAPPVLSAGIKAGMMRRMVEPRHSDHVLDLGCGAGKFALATVETGAHVVGADIAPFFLPRAERCIDLVQCDLRRLPFRKGAFEAGYSLDVLEHVDEPGVVEILVEARRALTPSGRLFVYTHAMESSRLAQFQRRVNLLAGWLDSKGLVDQQRERMRKSDHVNAMRSHEHFDQLCAEAGLRVEKRRYYNVVFKAVIEDLLLRLLEHARSRPKAEVGGSATRQLSARSRACPNASSLAGHRSFRTDPDRPLLRPATTPAASRSSEEGAILTDAPPLRGKRPGCPRAHGGKCPCA
jgi:ubiquinone/menaquinone biosynthesis C-methylase UbiE